MKSNTNQLYNTAIMPRKKAIELAIEAICNKGCKQVHIDILAIKNQQHIPKELDLFHFDEQQIVLMELEKIMAVYGDRCQL